MPVRLVEVRDAGADRGAVALAPNLGYYAFEYDSRFSQVRPSNLAPLAMPLSEGPGTVRFCRPARVELQAAAGNAGRRPAGRFGNALIDAWMASKGIERRVSPLLTAWPIWVSVAWGRWNSNRPAPLPWRAARQSSCPAWWRAPGRRSTANLARTTLPRPRWPRSCRSGRRRAVRGPKRQLPGTPATDEILPGQFDVEPGFEHWLLKFDGMGADRELGRARRIMAALNTPTT